MNKEIELKFDITDIPNLKEYENIKIYKIIQHYIYQDQFSAIRKRKILNLQNKEWKYIYTVKTKGDIKNKNSVYEIETEIEKEEYDSIKIETNSIEKYRLKIPINNGLIAELDLYYGNVEGLITVEVELEDESKSLEFKKPKWFGDELNKKIFSNANLSGMNRESFLELMNKDQLEKNLQMKIAIENYVKLCYTIS